MTLTLAAPQPPPAKRPRLAVDGTDSGAATQLEPQPQNAADSDVDAAAEAPPAAAAYAGGAAAAAPAAGTEDGSAALQNVCPLPLRYLRGRSTGWQPSTAAVTLNVRLDGRIVPSAGGGARVSYSHIAVLDGFIDEPTRGALLGFLTRPAGTDAAADGGAAGGGAESAQGVAGAGAAGIAAHGGRAGGGNGGQSGEGAAGGRHAAVGTTRLTEGGGTTTGGGAAGGTAAAGTGAGAATSAGVADEVLPGDKWERRTADQAGLTPTWGVKVGMLRCLHCTCADQGAGSKHGQRRITTEGPLALPSSAGLIPILFLPRLRIPPVPGLLKTSQSSSSFSRMVSQEHVLMELATGELGAVQEVHARLLALYPEYDIAHMPSDLLQAGSPQRHGGGGGSTSGDADCDQFVANAAVHGDSFAWHIDADPVGVLRHCCNHGSEGSLCSDSCATQPCPSTRYPLLQQVHCTPSCSESKSSAGLPPVLHLISHPPVMQACRSRRGRRPLATTVMASRGGRCSSASSCTWTACGRGRTTARRCSWTLAPTSASSCGPSATAPSSWTRYSIRDFAF